MRLRLYHWLFPLYSIEILWDSTDKTKLHHVSQAFVKNNSLSCVMPSRKVHIFPLYAIREIVIMRDKRETI